MDARPRDHQRELQGELDSRLRSHNGGLGIHDLKRFSCALRLRWLWLAWCHPELVWFDVIPRGSPSKTGAYSPGDKSAREKLGEHLVARSLGIMNFAQKKPRDYESRSTSFPRGSFPRHKGLGRKPTTQRLILRRLLPATTLCHRPAIPLLLPPRFDPNCNMIFSMV